MSAVPDRRRAGPCVRSTRYLGSFPAHRAEQWTMIGQDGGQSIPLPDATLFVFSDTLLAARSTHHPERPVPRAFRSTLGARGMFLANSAAIGAGPDLRRTWAGMQYFLDGDGFVRQILEPLDRERLQGIRFWPEHGICIDGRVYLYYLGVQTTDPGSIWGFRTLGTGLAVLDPASGRCERLRSGGDWRLWPCTVDDLHFGVQVLREDDWLYVFASVREGLFTTARVARVRADDVTHPARYEFLQDPEPRWGPSLDTACNLGLCGGDYSVSFNAHLGRYLMCYVESYGKRLTVRTAPRPWGPYDDPITVVGVPHEAASELVYLGFEHPHYSSDGGRTVFISYCQPHFTSNSLMSVRFD